MGAEQLQIGADGEAKALGLLRTLFHTTSVVSPGDPIDIQCSQLRHARLSSEVRAGLNHVDFRFQVKTSTRASRDAATPTAPAFRSPRSTFQQWLYRHVEHSPVILLLVSIPNSFEQSFYYLPLHDYVLSPAGQRQICNAGKPGELSISGRRFSRVPPDCDNFHWDLVREAKRIKRTGDSPFARTRAHKLTPFGEALLLQRTELAGFIEPPIRVAERLRHKHGDGVPEAVGTMLQTGECDDELVDEWLSYIRQQNTIATPESFARRQLASLVAVLRNPNALMQFPQFESHSVNVWRTLIATYPASVQALARTARYSQDPKSLMYVSTMMPMLALDGQDWSGHAHDVLRILEERQGDFSSYAFQRELFRGRAEAGIPGAQDLGVEFLLQHKGTPAEASFLRTYGWTPDVLQRNLDRKRGNPTLRDTNLPNWYQAMADVLLKK